MGWGFTWIESELPNCFQKGQPKLDRRVGGRGWGVTWTHLDSLEHTWIHLDSVGLIHLG